MPHHETRGVPLATANLASYSNSHSHSNFAFSPEDLDFIISEINRSLVFERFRRLRLARLKSSHKSSHNSAQVLSESTAKDPTNLRIFRFLNYLSACTRFKLWGDLAALKSSMCRDRTSLSQSPDLLVWPSSRPSDSGKRSFQPIRFSVRIRASRSILKSKDANWRIANEDRGFICLKSENLAKLLGPMTNVNRSNGYY